MRRVFFVANMDPHGKEDASRVIPLPKRRPRLARKSRKRVPRKEEMITDIPMMPQDCVRDLGWAVLPEPRATSTLSETGTGTYAVAP